MKRDNTVRFDNGDSENNQSFISRSSSLRENHRDEIEAFLNRRGRAGDMSASRTKKSKFKAMQRQKTSNFGNAQVKKGFTMKPQATNKIGHKLDFK